MTALMAANPTDPADRRKITQLRVEPDLWERVTRQARRSRMSANAYVCNALEAVVTVDERNEEHYQRTPDSLAERLSDR